MNNEMLDKWLKEFSELERKYDRFWELKEKAEREGRKELAKRNDYKMDVVAAKQEGMILALEIFGYAVKYQDGKYVVVVR